MGFGSWDVGTYAKNTGHKVDTGTTFAYSSTMHNTSYAARKAHDDLDPTKLAGPASPLAGKPVRESRDSTDHPNAIPVVVGFDVTGSMGTIPAAFVSKLKDLFGLLQRKGYIEDPQVLIGAIGDAYADRVPLQVGQFESDNRVDDALDNVFLEGGGGGGGNESYDLFMWYIAHQTITDAYDKRGKKGYCFIIGDERAYTELPADQIESHIGIKVQGPITLKDITRDLQDKWETFIIIPTEGAYPADAQAAWWSQYFPKENILVLQAKEDVAELIALTIGTVEGVIDLGEGLEDLLEIGSTAGISVGKALAKRTSQSSKMVSMDVPTDLEVSEETSERI